MSDPVNPSHYDGTIDRLIAKHGLPAVVAHFEVDASRYEDRAGKKADNPAEQDLAKAAKCRELAAELRARLPQELLTGERETEIRQKHDVWTRLLVGRGAHKFRPEHAEYNKQVHDLLQHIDALQAYYTTRYKEREQQVVAALLPPARLSYIQEVAEALEPLGQGLVRELLADREALGGYYAGRERERTELVRAELAAVLRPLDGYESSMGGYMELSLAKSHNATIHHLAERLNASL